MDEKSNRTAVILHVLAAITATSVKCYEQAILLVLCLVKEKKINLGMTIKHGKMLFPTINNFFFNLVFLSRFVCQSV